MNNRNFNGVTGLAARLAKKDWEQTKTLQNEVFDLVFAVSHLGRRPDTQRRRKIKDSPGRGKRGTRLA